MNISYSASDLYQKISSNGNAYISSYRKRVREADTNVQDIKKDVEALRKNIADLKNYNAKRVTRDKLEKYLKKFTDSYNKFSKKAENITDKELSETFDKLESFLTENEKDLKEIGLRKSKGKWTFDSDDFKEAKEKDINKLFEGKDCLFRQMNRLMYRVEKKTEEEEFQMVFRNLHHTTKYSQEEMTQAQTAKFLNDTIEGLQSNALTEDDRVLKLKDFCSQYNTFVDTAADSIKETVGYMTDKIKEAEVDLKNIGIELTDGKLIYNDAKATDDVYQASYAALFGEKAAYGDFGKLMQTYAKNIFQTTLKTDSLGITIDSYA